MTSVHKNLALIVRITTHEVIRKDYKVFSTWPCSPAEVGRQTTCVPKTQNGVAPPGSSDSKENYLYKVYTYCSLMYLLNHLNECDDIQYFQNDNIVGLVHSKA